MRGIFRTTGFLIAAVLISAGTVCNAQSKAELQDTASFWVEPGLGASNLGISITNGFNYQRNRLLLSARLTLTTDDLLLSSADAQSLFEAGILAGTGRLTGKNKTIWYSMSAGLGIITETRCGENCGLLSGPSIDERSTTIGLPAGANLIWRPFKFMGIGIQASANLNPIEPFGAGHLVLQIGKLYE